MTRLRRGEIWWADLGEPRGSDAGYTRPVLVVQEDAINQTALQTSIAVPLTTNQKYRDIGSNVVITAKDGPLDIESVAQIHLIQAVPLDRFLQRLGRLSPRRMTEIDVALMQALGLYE